jgi:hypothetical protein
MFQANMDVAIRSKQNYVLHFSGSETLSELKARVAEVEKCEDVCLYVAGKPLDLEADDLTVSVLENYSVDVTIPLFGGKVKIVYT